VIWDGYLENHAALCQPDRLPAVPTLKLGTCVPLAFVLNEAIPHRREASHASIGLDLGMRSRVSRSSERGLFVRVLRHPGALCKQCNELLSKDARACVIFGTAIGAGAVAPSVPQRSHPNQTGHVCVQSTEQ